MIKFIIVEDEKKYHDIHKNIIDKIMFKNDNNYEIQIYERYTPKLKSVIKDPADTKIYIMDIEIQGDKSGLDIGREVRKDDWDSEILFITNHDKMYDTVYESLFKVFCFIRKFHNLENTLTKKLSLIVNRKFDNRKFFYTSGQSDLQIFAKDIIYIYRETTSRKLMIKTTRGEYAINMTLQDALTKLDDRFRQVHRACIVNNDYVQEYNWSQGYFTLSTGEKVDMCSKNFRKSKGKINE